MFVIRKAGNSDIDLIREMAQEVFPHTYQSILTPDQINFMLDWMYSPQSLHKQMEEDGHLYYIAWKGGKAVGYVSVQPQGEHLFHLQKIYVLPAYQKERLGRMLFKHALAVVKEMHPQPCTVELNVNRYNPALGFYQHMGMKKVREGDFPIGGGYYMNDYIMSIDI